LKKNPTGNVTASQSSDAEASKTKYVSFSDSDSGGELVLATNAPTSQDSAVSEGLQMISDLNKIHIAGGDINPDMTDGQSARYDAPAIGNVSSTEFIQKLVWGDCNPDRTDGQSARSDAPATGNASVPDL
jgi:hypothetical protein